MTPPEQIIPYGFCHCGCGQRTTIAKFTNTKHGRRCGQPNPYCTGHGKKFRHGHSEASRVSRTYNTWRAMIGRCRHPSNVEFPRYGGSGVTVCPRWLTFCAFLSDMGERPEGKTIDRFPNPAGNYELENCRWATPHEQNMNRRQKA